MEWHFENSNVWPLGRAELICSSLVYHLVRLGVNITQVDRLNLEYGEELL